MVFIKSIIIVLFVIMICSCVQGKQTKLITNNAIDLCGCNRECVYRTIKIKGYNDINEKEYKKNCK